MPNVTITIENPDTAFDTMQVRLIVYNPKMASVIENNSHSTQYVLPSASAEKILNVIKEDTGLFKLPAGSSSMRADNDAISMDQHLTGKEKQVLKLLSKGYSYKMIAEELQKSVETIRVQIKSIYKKLQVCSNTQAILKAMGNGLL